MSERELRDQVEALFDELKREKAKLEVSEAEVLSAERTKLLEELPRLRARVAELPGLIEAAEQKTKQARDAIDSAQSQISKLRRRVAAREPLGNPLEPSYANWEQRPQGGGCAMGLVLLVSSVSLMVEIFSAWR